MSLEPCPFCGKLFKRLKAHLPHCKMDPGYNSTNTGNAPKKVLSTSLKQSNKAKTSDARTDRKLNPSFFVTTTPKLKSKEVEELDKHFQNTSINLPSITKFPLGEGMNPEPVKPKMKWLAKREQESLKQANFLTQMKIKMNSDTHKDEYNNRIPRMPAKGIPHTERENVNMQKGIMGEILTSQVATKTNTMAPDPLQNDPWTKSFQAVQSIPQCKENARILEQIRKNPNKDVFAPSAKEQAAQIYFQTKTCVWDHIKDGLYDKHISVLATNKGSKCGNNSASVCKPQTVNNINTATNAASAQSFPVMQPSVQNISVLAYTPDMTTGYGGTQFLTSHSEISLCENQSSKFAPCQGPVAEQKLADVRLCDLAVWIGTHTPRSPREGVAVLNKGWQRYYRKYIDVQKGGIGGIAMLIAGYCVLSYIWNYPHLKQERWRKYH